MEKKEKKLELLQVEIPAVRKERSQEPSTIHGAVHYSLPLCYLAKAERLGKTERLVCTPLPFLVSSSTSRVKHHPVSQESSSFLMLLICF